MSRVGQVLERRARWRRCRELLRDVTIPDPFDVDVFSRQVGERRGRPIHVLPQPGSSAQGPCGVWIAMTTEDVILVEPSVSPLHYEHIVLHELGHMLWDHATGAPDVTALAGRLMPDLDPALITRVLGRSSYSTPQEEEAEVLATMVGTRITHRAPSRPSQPPPAGEVAAVLGRLGDVLGTTGR